MRESEYFRIHTKKHLTLIIKSYSYPRAALIGNPSDGYFGKTIAFLFKNFRAEVILYESPELVIEPQDRDRSTFTSVENLAKDVRFYGYYGGIRLLKAAIKKFFDHCQEANIAIADKNFTIRYSTNIPNRLGLAGSSAIITAAMKALMRFYEIQIPSPHLANLVLSVEKDELRIEAGLQDRVAQAFATPVYMDFDRLVMEKQGYGNYQPIDPSLFPPLYIAYRTDLSEGSEVVHNSLRERYELGDQKIHKAIEAFSKLTVKAKKVLEKGQSEKLGKLLDANFDQRASIMKISKANRKMVEIARSIGASAKFTGSGGAIIGTYLDEDMYNQLDEKLGKKGIKVLKPQIISYKTHKI